MDIESLYYFSELSKSLNMTHTANRLYISQQTLSNHIQRLENFYGTPLFYRKPKLSLTSAGTEVLKFADMVIINHQNLKDTLSDMSKEERGTIRFSSSALRLSTCFSAVLPKFHERYPLVDFQITEAVTSKLVPLLTSNDLDLGIIAYSDSHPEIEQKLLLNDKLYLCVSEKLLDQFYPLTKERLKEQGIQGIEITHFSELPFCAFKNIVWNKIRSCFDIAGIQPKIYSYSTYTPLGFQLCSQGFAACIMTQMHLANHLKENPSDMNIFPIYSNGVHFPHQLAIAYSKGRYLPLYMRFLIKLLLEYASTIETVHLAHKVDPLV